MEKIELLRKINQDLKEGVKKKDPTSDIKYQNYDLIINDMEYIVSVPLRESENFEKAVSEAVIGSKRELKNLLRQFRGFIQV